MTKVFWEFFSRIWIKVVLCLELKYSNNLNQRHWFTWIIWFQGLILPTKKSKQFSGISTKFRVFRNWVPIIIFWNFVENLSWLTWLDFRFQAFRICVPTRSRDRPPTHYPWLLSSTCTSFFSPQLIHLLVQLHQVRQEVVRGHSAPRTGLRWTKKVENGWKK